MGWRFRKSYRLGKHARLYVRKSGIGYSYGGKGWRVGVGPRGSRRTVSLPGTGISYVSESGRGGGRRGGRGAPPGSVPVPAPPRRRRGCLHLGCFALALLVVLVAVIALVGDG